MLSRSGEESGLTETTAACTTPPILTPQATASPQDSAPSQHLNLEVGIGRLVYLLVIILGLQK